MNVLEGHPSPPVALKSGVAVHSQHKVPGRLQTMGVIDVQRNADPFP